MKILFADKFPKPHRERLEAAGHQCVFRPDTRAEELVQRIGDCEALVVRSTRVDADALEAANALELVIRAGAGTDTIDTGSASAKGIHVCNVPGRNAAAVAELTLGLLIAIDRRIPDNVIDLRAATWDKKRYSEARGLYGRRIGIVGLGSVGLAVAERARAFGLRVSVLSTPRHADTDAQLRELEADEVATLEALAECCDILTLHVPASEHTRGLIGAGLLSHIKPRAIIINTSRGDLIDEAALLAAIEEKDLRIGLDVYRDEPSAGQAAFDCPLARHPNVYGTHHIGASTEQAQNAVADGVLEIVRAFTEGRVLNCVNSAPESSPAAPAL